MRCIADVIPSLETWQGETSIDCDDSTARDIAADCLFYMDSNAVDATASERAAYRTLFRQIEKTIK
jgi:hypothetical protein